MGKRTEDVLADVKSILSEIALLNRAATKISFDRVTVCPDAGRQGAGEESVFLGTIAYRLRKTSKFTEGVIWLHDHRDELGELDAALEDRLYREYLREKNYPAELNEKNELARDEANEAWTRAHAEGDYSIYCEPLSNICASEIERVSHWEMPEGEECGIYDRMLEEYERGITTADFDEMFGLCGKELSELLRAIEEKGKFVRTDFLYRKVRDEQQQEIAEYLMDLLLFDRKRGGMTTGDYPFSEMISRDDIRIASQFEPENLMCNIYSILHECGHALFEQLQPAEDFEYYLYTQKTMGMHESVARFYENIIGRSKAFIRFIYPKLREVFPQVFYDVTEFELYEAVNVVRPSFIRMDADELTYTLHIIIRYEIEKDLVEGRIDASDIPRIWNEKYEKYLGITPPNDVLGVLQDSHWTSGFGYFPDYALGNFYSVMFANAMREAIDVDSAIAAGDFSGINAWMRDHVFCKADRLTPAEWIRDITGKDPGAEEFLTYIREKYSALYGLSYHGKSIEKNIHDYVQRMKRIRVLSSPMIDENDETDTYIMRLQENFMVIGELADENRDFLENDLYPMLAKDHVLTPEDINVLNTLSCELLDAEYAENIDLPIATIISDKVLEVAKASGDTEALIRQWDIAINAHYTMMNMTGRIYSYPRHSAYYREKGFQAGDFFIPLVLDWDRFSAIEDPLSRQLALTNARYSLAFFEGYRVKCEDDTRDLDLLEKLLAIYGDERYRQLDPDFDWDYYKYRIMEYYCTSLDMCNMRGLSKPFIERIGKMTEKMRDFYYSDLERFAEFSLKVRVDIVVIRNRYFAGMYTREEYFKQLLQAYDERDINDYSSDGIIGNMLPVVEYILLLDPEDLRAEEKSTIKMLYSNIIAYIFNNPNGGATSFLLEYVAILLNRFIEVPSGISFEEMVLKCMAALHPPTYIHSRMVGELSECVCSHLIRHRPDLFVGILGTTTEEEVLKKKAAIINLTYHAALCHDAGKLMIIDTIFVYGRRLLDMEFELIKTHPGSGYELLRRYESTAPYAEVAGGHHIWYDGSKGYPEEFDITNSSVSTLINIVSCMDCMDAATDFVGRSYRNGKTLSKLMVEFREGSGTRYAPYVVDVLEKEEVASDIQNILNRGRQQIYGDTFMLLSGVQKRGG